MPRPIAIAKPKNTRKSLRRFLATLKTWSVQIVIAMLLAVGAAVCSVFGPQLLGEMTNTAISNFGAATAANGGVVPDSATLAAAIDWGKLSQLAITLIILYIVSAALNYIQGAVLSVVSARYAEATRARILAKITHLPASFFDHHQIGDILSRMSNDVSMVSDTLTSVLSEIITSLTMLIGILIMMFTISVPLALITLVVVPVSLFVISFIARRAQHYFRLQQTTLGNIDNIIEEDYSGQTLIRVNNHSAEAEAQFTATNQKLYSSAWKAQFFGSLAFPITHVFTHFNYVLICIVGGRMAIDGTLLIGSVQAFIQYVNQFNRPINQVSQIAANIQQTLAAAERIFDFLDTPDEPADYIPAQTIAKVKGRVEFHHLDFGYSEDQLIIKDFSLKVQPGMQVAIVGPTGAGKTTLINLLMRFYEPTSGYITIDGTPIAEMTRADVRSLFGMVLQDTWLFSGTIEDNLRYGNPSATHADIVAAAKHCHVHHFIESLPKGYNTEISEESDNISAGEKQLLTIVRAMVAHPAMMILDEATSNVDTRTEQLIQDAFTKLTHGRTSFIIAHRLSTIRNSDLIVVLREGRIVEQGTHEQLLAQNGFYAELYNSQFAE